jgi:hypothetical protein
MKKAFLGIITIAIVSGGYCCPAGIIAHYKFDETSGTTAIDSVGVNNGTITGGVTIDQDGVAGRAYQFNGSNGYVDMGDASFIADLVEAGGASLNSFSFSGWVKHTASHSGQVVFIGNDQTGSDYIAYGPQNDTFRSWYRGAGGEQLAGIGPAINDGQWHHVALTVSPTQMITYIDGVAENVENKTYTSVNGANSFDIGRLGRSNHTDYSNGLIDDVQIYAGTLTQNDITYLMNNPGQVVPEPTAACLAIVGLLTLIGFSRPRKQ